MCTHVFVDERVEGLFGPVPALVAVHRVVAARRRSRSGRAAARRGRGRPSCGETSRPSVNAWSHVFSGANRSSAFTWSMCEWTPPWETRPEQVDVPAALERRRAARGSRRTSRPRSTCSRASDPGRAAGPQPIVRWPTSELPICPGGSPAASPDASSVGCGNVAPQPVEDRRVRELDRVSRAGRGAAPPVEDDERYEGKLRRQIAAKESTSSEAPPTSAPSTPGWPRSSAALSGLTEPP